MQQTVHDVLKVSRDSEKNFEKEEDHEENYE